MQVSQFVSDAMIENTNHTRALFNFQACNYYPDG